jgi:hypothetical protein
METWQQFGVCDVVVRRRAGRRAAAIERRAARGEPQVEVGQVDEARLGDQPVGLPARRHEGGAGLEQVVRAGDPRDAAYPHRLDLADQPHAARALVVDDVVVHFDRLDAVEQAEDGRRVVDAATDDGVVDHPVAAVARAGAVAAEPQHGTERRRVHDHVADHVGVLARQRRRPAGRRTAGIRADQFELVEGRAFEPVVVDLVALGTRLHQVAAVRTVHMAVLQAEHRARIGDLVGRHVDHMLRGAVAGVRDLAVLDGQRAGVPVGAEHAVRRAVVDPGIAHDHVVAVMEQAAEGRGRRAGAGQLDALEHHVVGADLQRVGSAAQDGPQTVARDAAQDDRNARRAAVAGRPDHATGVDFATVEFDHIAGLEVDRGEQLVQAGVRLAWSDLIGRRECVGSADEQSDEGQGRHGAPLHRSTPRWQRQRV